MLTVNVRGPIRPKRATLGGKIRYFPPTNDYATGYGRISLAIMEAVDVVECPAGYDLDFALCYPGGELSARLRFTMWEPDEIPQRLAKFLNDGALIVPCRHNVDVFRNAGFNRKIHVVPLWGEAEYTPLPDDSVLRFITVGRDNGVRSRKGIDSLIEYFLEAFPGRNDVALTIKSSPHCFQRDISDSRITIIRKDLPVSEYNQLLASHHCGVFMSGLEAWNFPACELMAAGRPSIIVPYGGPTEFTTPETSWHLPFGMVGAPEGHPYYGVGMGARPTRGGVISALRECYENRDMLRRKAEASRQMSMRFTKAHFIERLRVVVREELGRF